MLSRQIRAHSSSPSLVDPLPEQAMVLYEVQQSKIKLIESTSIEINKLCLIIEYLKDMDQRNELLTDKLQREKLYEHVVDKLNQQSIPSKHYKHKHSNRNKQREIQKIIASFRRGKNYNGGIEKEITQSIESKMRFLQHITAHIQHLRDQIKALTDKIKAKTFECDICSHILDSNHKFKVSACGKTLCQICMRRHIFSSIERKKETPKCPFFDCDHDLAHFDDLRAVLSSKEYDKINYDLNMNAIAKMNGIKHCLTPNCDYAIQYDMSRCSNAVRATKFECPKCKQSSCLQCKTPWHNGFDTCKAFKRSLNKIECVAVDEKYSEWKDEKGDLVKECPGCHAHVEKNEGCNHMTCRCGTEWCWLCREILECEEDIEGHFDEDNHPQFDESDEEEWVEEESYDDDW